jgi:hypothetical protein
VRVSCFKSSSPWKLGLTIVMLLSAACTGSKKSEPLTLTVGFTNDMVGNIISCGCRVNDYGGIGRRATMIKAVRDTAQNFLLLEGGDFFSDKVTFGKEKAEVTLKSMAVMDYDGVVPGEKDFGFGLDYLKKRCRDEGLPVLVSNLYDAAADTLLFPPSRTVVLSGGLRIGLIGVIDSSLAMPPQIPEGSILIKDPVQAVHHQLQSLGETVDLVVVLAHMKIENALVLARKVNQIDLLMVGHHGRFSHRDQLRGNAYILQAPENGRYMGFAFSVLDDHRKIHVLKSRVEPLADTYPDDPAVVDIFAAYHMSIEATEKSLAETGLFKAEDSSPQPYVGAEKCAECHGEIYAQWHKTDHAHAFDILVAQSRDFDRDCTPCHVTGYNHPGGFNSLGLTPRLIHVQCESCHGNGFEHANSAAMTTPAEPMATCLNCHTPAQSPNFVPEEKWRLIQH